MPKRLHHDSKALRNMDIYLPNLEVKTYQIWKSRLQLEEFIKKFKGRTTILEDNDGASLKLQVAFLDSSNSNSKVKRTSVKSGELDEELLREALETLVLVERKTKMSKRAVRN